MKKYAMYIVVSSALMILFCLIYQGTYSYFVIGLSNEKNPNDKTTIVTANLQNLTLVSTSSNGSNTLIPGESVTSSFEVTNPSSVKMCFDLLWNNVVNTFVNKNDLLVSLKDSKNNSLYNGVFPSDASILLSGLSILANASETYTITVTYQNTEENQFADMGSTFSANISGQLSNCTP